MKTTGLHLPAGEAFIAIEIVVQSFHELAAGIMANDLAQTQAAAERMTRHALSASVCADKIAGLAQGMRTHRRAA